MVPRTRTKQGALQCVDGPTCAVGMGKTRDKDEGAVLDAGRQAGEGVRLQIPDCGADVVIPATAACGREVEKDTDTGEKKQ